MSSDPDFSADWATSSSMCRVCLRSEPAATWNLFECSTAAGRKLAEALSAVGGIPVQKGDNFPQSCCSDCFRKIEVAFELREKFLESNRQLEEIFVVTVKNELYEEDDSTVVGGGTQELEEGSIAAVLQNFGLEGFTATVEGQDVETVELFSCLLEQDLQKMLPNETVGTILRFRKAVEHAKQLLSQSSAIEKKSAQAEPEPVPRKKRRLEVLPPAILSPDSHLAQVNLDELLKTFDGRGIMIHYKRNGNQLDKKAQGKLLKLIVEKLSETVQIQDIRRSWFNVIFAAIVEIFPSERDLQDLYWDKLNQIRYKMKRKFSSSTPVRPQVEQSSGGDKEVEGNLVDESEALASKVWLQRGREPWEAVVEHWDKSFQLRCKVYKSDSGNKLGELCRDDGWPILKETNGIELIRRDFDRIFEPTGDVFQVWNRIKKGVCTFGRLNLKNKALLDMLAKFEEGGWTDDHLFIQLLAALLPSGYVARKFRPRNQDTYNAFMREITSTADIPEAIERYRTALAEHRLTVQPHVLFISGENRYLIYADKGRYYEARGLLDAIDGVLKLCMVMEMGYAADCKPMWTFIQRFCYGLKMSGDNMYACLKALHAFLLQAQEKV